MFAGPPWISTRSGYLRDGSKPDGSAIMLWMRRPRVLVNQKCWSGCQSIAAAFAVANFVSAT